MNGSLVGVATAAPKSAITRIPGVPPPPCIGITRKSAFPSVACANRGKIGKIRCQREAVEMRGESLLKRLNRIRARIDQPQHYQTGLARVILVLRFNKT